MFSNFLNIKNEQKNNIFGIDIPMMTEVAKETLFRVDDKNIYFNGEPIDLEKFLLDKIQLNDYILKTIEDEAKILENKMTFLLKSKEDKLYEIKNKNKILEKYINDSVMLKNQKINDVVGVINGKYTNIIPSIKVYNDNINILNNKYSFIDGERFLLNKNSYKIIESIPNEKMEIIIKDKTYINYILFNNILETLDNFEVRIFEDNKEVYSNKELNISKYPLLEIDSKVTKIILKGVGTRAIMSDVVICGGKKIYDLNRGVVVYEADFSETKLPNFYHINCNDDIKVFFTNKKEFNRDNLLTYQEFKEKYFLIEKNALINKKIELDLQNNFLIAFVETERNALSSIKIYGVD